MIASTLLGVDRVTFVVKILLESMIEEEIILDTPSVARSNRLDVNLPDAIKSVIATIINHVLSADKKYP
jgi:hypothetical protein